jgi:hypothetical protein
MEEFKGDKRSKEYKQWKKNHAKASKGLGDKVEKAFKKVGIDKAAKFILGEDCGCDERKNTLNKMFPSKKIECLTEDEYNYLDTFFKSKTKKITPVQQNELILIYNRVFNGNAVPTSCSSCFLNSVYDKLNKIFNEYK